MTREAGFTRNGARRCTTSLSSPKYFEATLASRNGARGRGYLLDRGIHATTQLKFRLGYAKP